MVAGLATITPASGTVGPQGALLIGFLAGLVCFYATQMIKSYFKIDDSLDVFPVHGVGGILGILMLAFVGKPESFLGAGASGFDGSVFSQFMIQLQGVVIICLWTLVFSWIALRVTSLITNLRVSNEDEDEGLDFGEHNESAYHSN
jgi:Amt family ammonium transporter